MRFDRLIEEIEGFLVGRLGDVGVVLLIVALGEVLERVDDLRDASLRLPDADAALEHGQLGGGFLRLRVEQG